MKIVDLAKVIDNNCQRPVIGIRSGEKLHEVMVPLDDGRHTMEFENHFVIPPPFTLNSTTPDTQYYTELGGKPCSENFYYGSDNNDRWLTRAQLEKMISQLDLPEAQAWTREKGLKS